jgi:acid phosphatase (class A)
VTITLRATSIGPLLTLLLWVLPLPVQAEPARDVGAYAQGIALDRRALRQAMGPPPAAGSEAASNDLAILLWLQNARTPEMEANTWLTLDRNPMLFSRAMGVDLQQATPTLTAGLRAFLAPINAEMGRFKRDFARPRPFVQYPQIQPCLPREDSASYPSGHSTWYRATAELLADLIPERRERLLSVGYHGGASRATCGAHFPSDVEAGQRLGAVAARQVIATPQWQAFRKDPVLQAELEQLRRVPADRLMLLTR